MWPVKYLKDSLVKFTYIDFIKLSLNFCHMSYLKTFLKSWISGQQSYHLHFSSFRLFHCQIIVWNLKFWVKQRNCREKVLVQLQKAASWILNNYFYFFISNWQMKLIRKNNQLDLALWKPSLKSTKTTSEAWRPKFSIQLLTSVSCRELLLKRNW